MTSRIALAVCLLVSSAHAQWSAPVTAHRVDPNTLQTQPDERGFLRVARLVLGANSFVPLRDNDELISIGAAGQIGIDVPLGVAFTVGTYVRSGWWREGRDDISDETQDHVMLDLGVKLRVRATLGTFSVFLGGQGGMSRDWHRSNVDLAGYHVGAHAGFHVGRDVGAEVELGINHRDFGFTTWLDAHLNVAITIVLRSPR